jgi:dihydropyrimidinase
MDKPGVEGAMWCCSPPPRDVAAQEAVWAALIDGTFQIFSSDHAPFQFNKGGKIPKGNKTTFKEMANGVPGIELRLPLLFSEGVQKGRISLQQFVALGSTNHARLYGLYPRKGTIAVGSDADLVIWDAEKKVTVRWDDLHDNVGYTPYEGRQLKGWPIAVVSRGRVIVENGKLDAQPGSGKYLPCNSPDSAQPKGHSIPEIGSMTDFGLKSLF